MRKLYLVLLGFALMTPALFAGDHARDHWKHSRNRYQHERQYRSHGREWRGDSYAQDRARHRSAAYRRHANRHWRDNNRGYEYRRARYGGGYHNGLPHGLAKRGGELPSGLQKHVDRTGHLPPGLEKKQYRH